MSKPFFVVVDPLRARICRGRSTPCPACRGAAGTLWTSQSLVPLDPIPQPGCSVPPPPPLLWIWKISAWETRVGETTPQPPSRSGRWWQPLSLSWFAAGEPARPGCLAFFNMKDGRRCARARPKRVLPNSNFHSSRRGAIAIHSRISSSKAVSPPGHISPRASAQAPHARGRVPASVGREPILL